MFLGARHKILAKINDLIDISDHRADRMRIAVAFWGNGSDQLIRGNGHFQILCNLEHPGTHPWVIERIRGLHNVDIRRLDELHAKVFIGSGGVFVGSANLSERALGMQRSDVQGWIEAGVYIEGRSDDQSEANAWFESIWATAGEITDKDLELAKASWQQRGGEQLEDSEAAIDPPALAIEPIESCEALELFEEHVFEDKALSRNSGNMTRMASKKLEYLYYQAFPAEEKNKSTIKVPAHAANLLWTLSGQTVRTNIKEMPEFKSPEMVVDRSMLLNTFVRLQAFMEKLAHGTDVRPEPAVRYWAQKFKQ